MHELSAVTVQFHRAPASHVQQLRAVSYNCGSCAPPEAKALDCAFDLDGVLPRGRVGMGNIRLIVTGNRALTVIAPVDSEAVTSTRVQGQLDLTGVRFSTRA